MNECRDLLGCPASMYFNCPAYLMDKNCWEVSDVQCCRRNDKTRCQACSVYLMHLSGKKEQVYPMTVVKDESEKNLVNEHKHL
ncbi:hypothetical protein [Candidatus Oleimmundimicrobium sp.]|uniref:hypothetical protein n=1 Tax=Candidatus Oleimmundimicrobium sp. TaxID=3060597 RepID=UPI00271920E0|nr:hypothetical protein [Candidatus Oleimmundimicrobium sp.]MDO8885499.1 hypothetical protein [Candidatus Oleimmundimicrobium sp.]